MSDKEVGIISGSIIIAIIAFLIGGLFVSVVKGYYVEDITLNNKTEDKVIVEEEVQELDRELTKDELVMNALGINVATNLINTDIKFNEYSREDIFANVMKMLIFDKKYVKIDTTELGDVYYINLEQIKGYAYRIFNYSDFIYLESSLGYTYDKDLNGFTFNLDDLIIDEIILTNISYSDSKAYISYYNLTSKKSVLITFINENNFYRIINILVS